MKKQFKYFSYHGGFKFLLSFVFVLLLVSCEEEHPTPIGSDDMAPGQVSNVKSIPTPGGADVIYTMPNSANLSYVEAVVNTPEGKVLKFNASAHRDTISVVGLATSVPQEVLLYSVSKSNVKSEPVSITINPQTPPYLAIFESMKIEEGLGGVEVKYQNDSDAEIALYIGRMVDGKFIEDDSHYYDKIKDRNKNRHLFWGYTTEKQTFGVFVRDRWNHYSDTLFGDITPILELMMDKSKFKAVNLQNDSQYKIGQYERFSNLWDGKWSDDYSNPYNGNNPSNPATVYWEHANLAGDEKNAIPGAGTIDMGQEVTISRIVVNHYWQYSGDAPRKYEIYGLIGNNEDNLQHNMGAWHYWTLLAQVEQVKPSTAGGTTEDDEANWEAGDTILLTPPSDPVRYIRIKAIESWNGKLNWDAVEITVYGAYTE